MHEVLKQGKQVLVLVPEIGLTLKPFRALESRFNCDIALLHSGLNDSKRLQAWQQAQTGKASIILGTRSAIYTPLPRLGLIILDEEHDLSYKQQEGSVTMRVMSRFIETFTRLSCSFRFSNPKH